MDRLKKGDTAVVVSLSSGILGEPFIKHELELGEKRLGEFGLKTAYAENALKGLDFIKNHPEKRAEDLKNAFLNKDAKLILSAIGGVDGYKVLPYIFEDETFAKVVKENPKIFMGYSDTTVFHLALNKLGLSTFYGPALITDFAEFENEMLPYTKKSLGYLFSPEENYEVKSSELWYDERTDFSPSAVGTNRVKHEEKTGFHFLKGEGIKTGKLYGGCIDVISSLISGKNCKNGEIIPEKQQFCEKYGLIKTKNELEGHILFLETSDEKPTKEAYREMITILNNYGMFDKISALLIGKPMDETFISEYDEVLKSELSSYDFPIVSNLNFGHSFPRMVLPYGAIAEVNTKEKTIKILTTTLK